MWKKGDAEEPAVSRPPERSPAPGPQAAEPRRAVSPGDRAGAVIGPSILIKGDISGEEDLLVQGRVEGSIDLAAHSITVGTDGHVQADTLGRMVTIEGEVEGDVRGEEKVVLRPTARVRGNIAAPRVALEDGAKFQGTIDMDFELKRPERAVTTSSAARSSAGTGAGASAAARDSGSGARSDGDGGRDGGEGSSEAAGGPGGAGASEAASRAGSGGGGS